MLGPLSLLLLTSSIQATEARGEIVVEVPASGDLFGHDIDLVVKGIRTSVLASDPSPSRQLGENGAVWVLSLLDGVAIREQRCPEGAAAFGRALAVGELDGEGDPELVVTSGGWESGLVGTVRVLSSDGANELWRRKGGDADDFFGHSVCTADTNGDGTLDVLVGAPGARGGAGAVYGYSGADGETLGIRYGEHDGQGLGWALVACGDYDGDGSMDLAVCSRPAASSSLGLAGVQVLSGADFSILRDFPTEGAPFSIAVSGDVDGDSLPDLIVGAPDFAVGKREYGSCVQIVGSSRGPLRTLRPEDARRGVGRARRDRPLREKDRETWFGSSVASIGDVDGDGRDDIVVGDPERCVVSVHSGADGTRLYAIRRPTLTGFGHRVRGGIGDLDGDRVPDLLVSSCQPLYTRGAVGEVAVFSGADGAEIAVFGRPTGDQFGRRVAGGGDVDGDGVPDVLVTDPSDPEGGYRAGRVWAFRGTDRRALWSLSGRAGQELGSAVEVIPDVDGDGCDDLILGARPRDVASSLTEGAWAHGLLPLVCGESILLSSRSRAELRRFDGRLVGALDLSGDDVLDYLVTDPLDADEAGVLRAISGSDGSLLYELRGRTRGALLGLGASLIPDVDHDAIRDFVISAPGSTSSTGYVEVRSGSTGSLVTRLEGSGEGSLFGTVVEPFVSSGETMLAIAASPRGGSLHERGAAVFVFEVSGSLLDELRLPGVSMICGLEVAREEDSVGFLVADPLATAPLGTGTAPIALESARRVVRTGAVTRVGYPGGEVERWATGADFRNMGASLSAIGDVDGDGTTDFAVGDADPLRRSYGGSVTLLSGSSGDVIGVVRRPSTP